MASANLAAYNSATKQTWTENDLAEQLYQGDDFLSAIEKTKRYQVGRQAVTPIHTSRNAGYTALGAGGGNLNTAGNQGSAQATWNYAHHHQQYAIEGELIDGTLSDVQAVVNAIDTELTGAMSDLRRQLQRQLFMAGDAQISVCGVTSASTTVVLDAVGGRNAIERGWLFKNAVVDIGTAANPVLRANGVSILSVDDAAFTFTLAAPITTAITDQVSWKGSRTATPAVFEMNGLPNIVNNTTLGGVVPATEPVWKSYVDSTSQTLTLPQLYLTRRKAWQRVGQKDGPNWLITGFKQQEQLYKLLQAQTRFAGDVGLDTGNVDAAAVKGLRLEVVLDCKDEHLFLVNQKDVFICSTEKPYFQNKVTGGEVWAWIQGTDSYGGKITYRMQLCARRRNSAAAFTNLQ